MISKNFGSPFMIRKLFHFIHSFLHSLFTSTYPVPSTWDAPVNEILNDAVYWKASVLLKGSREGGPGSLGGVWVVTLEQSPEGGEGLRSFTPRTCLVSLPTFKSAFPPPSTSLEVL